MNSQFGPNSEAVAIRLPKLDGNGAGELRGSRPIVVFSDQGLQGSPIGRSLDSFGQLRSPSTPFNIDRAMFVVDRSNSMSFALRSGDRIPKIKYLQERIAQLSEDYLPPDTAVSLIFFDRSSEVFDCGLVKYGAFARLKEYIASLTLGGGTEFSQPFNQVANILRSDRERATREGRDIEDRGLRSLLCFLTDGQERPSVSPAHEVLRSIRGLNATSFLCGLGEDYDMPRIIHLASHAGPTGWSHMPMETPLADPLLDQLPSLIHHLQCADSYLGIRVQGEYYKLVAATPSIRDVPNDEHEIRLGYFDSSVAIVFERYDNINLSLMARRHYDDRDASSQNIRIVDSSEAGAFFEQQLAAEDFVDRYLLLQGLIARDHLRLRALVEKRPDFAPVIDPVLEELRFYDDNTHFIHSAMTVVGSLRGAPIGAPKPPIPHLHSGGLGPLDQPPRDTIPEMGDPDPAAYDEESPNNCPSFKTAPSLLWDEVTNGARQTRTVSLDLLNEGKTYVFGRIPDPKDGEAGLTINGSGVTSRRHFSITGNDDRYYITDLSTHGTSVNGLQIARGTPHGLCDGAVIFIPGFGTITFKLRL